jgi:hypothetical protein
MNSVWMQVNEATISHEAWQELSQGDLLQECLVPYFRPDIKRHGPTDDPISVDVRTSDLIIVTHSCDLANAKAQYVALCPFHTVAKFGQQNQKFTKKDVLEQVRKGQMEGLHLLASPTAPEDNQQALVIDFREIVSLPLEYLKDRAGELDTRWRLNSPFLEHFSQAFARFFMRVGLPSSIPKFK